MRMASPPTNARYSGRGRLESEPILPQQQSELKLLEQSVAAPATFSAIYMTP